MNFTRVPFLEAIRFLREKTNIPTESWLDLEGQMHAKAFAVAGAAQQEIVEDFHEYLDIALKEGKTLAWFRKEGFDKIVKKYGWSYKGGRGWRSSIIYDTNMRTARSAGHYAQIMDPAVQKTRPYLRYIANRSRHPRQAHSAWDGLILRADDPWWATHWPPNGWGCNCGIVSMGSREIKRAGLAVAKQAPVIETYKWVNKKTGKTYYVPRGIDPGWQYNPGHAAWGNPKALNQ